MVFSGIVLFRPAPAPAFLHYGLNEPYRDGVSFPLVWLLAYRVVKFRLLRFTLSKPQCPLFCNTIFIKPDSIIFSAKTKACRNSTTRMLEV